MPRSKKSVNAEVFKDGPDRLVVSTGGAAAFPVESGATDADFLPTGLTHFGDSSASTYTMANPPRAGVHKWLVSTDASTGGPVQKVRVSTGGGGVKIGAGTTNLAIEFESTGAAAKLVSRSTARWDIVAVRKSSGISLSTG